MYTPYSHPFLSTSAMTFPSSSTSEFLYIYVLFSKRTRFESTRNTRRLAMHRPVMHCFREAIPPAPTLRCSAEPRRARFQPSAPVTPWESEFAYRKSRSRIDPRSSPVIRYFVTSFFFPPLFFLPSFLSLGNIISRENVLSKN